MKTLECEIDGRSGIDVAVNRLVIAGWAGRDANEVEHHIRELEALGVRRPASVPWFYEIAPSLLTTAERIDVVGGHSSGEVEVVLIQTENAGLLVGIGSDHTDRRGGKFHVGGAEEKWRQPVGPPPLG